MSGTVEPLRPSGRADERTRTADLLITSDNRSGALSCLVVQNACKPALIYLQLPSATSSPALPVVSEWYRKATADASTLLSNEWSFYTLNVPGVRGVA